MCHTLPSGPENRAARAKIRYHTSEAHRRYARSNALKQATGWTLEQKEAAFVAQEGRCGICHTSLPDVDSSHADHNHVTLERRELLCRKCNQMIGCAVENPAILEAAVAYLVRHA